MRKRNDDTSGGKGTLIVFEGISGCGKSETVDKLRSYLAEKGFKTCVIEWNSNKIIRKITSIIGSKKLLTSNIYSYLQWLSFFIDYYFKIIPLLKENYILIADRYVYTGLTRDIANGARGRLGRWIYRIVIKPDLLFFYDIDPRVCYERISKRGKDLFHTNKSIMKSKTLKNKNLYYLAKIRREYLRLFDNPEVRKETRIIRFKDNNECFKKHVEDYISIQKEMHEYV